jgi:hypothetical protein
VGTVLNVVAGVGRISMDSVIKGEPFLMVLCAAGAAGGLSADRDRAGQWMH